MLLFRQKLFHTPIFQLTPQNFLTTATFLKNVKKLRELVCDFFTLTLIKAGDKILCKLWYRVFGLSGTI